MGEPLSSALDALRAGSGDIDITDSPDLNLDDRAPWRLQMKSFLLISTAAAALWICGGGADARSLQGARTVQIIRMDVPPAAVVPVSAGAATAGEEIEPEHGQTDGGDGAEGVTQFRVHDLSRRWVRFQMGSGFAEPGASAMPSSIPSESQSFGVAGLTASLPISADRVGSEGTPQIDVPTWMRGGLAFSAAAARYVPGCHASGYRPTGFLGRDAEVRRAGYYGMMSRVACQHGIPVGLFDAMIIRESRYQPWVFSSKRAFGLTQLMPGTAAGLGVNRFSIEDNLQGGARYLRQQLDRFGHPHLALAAYNAGPGRVSGGMVPRIAETQAYVADILRNWGRLTGGLPGPTVQAFGGPGQAYQRTRPVRGATVMSF
jgi:hypothetical protein